MCSFCATLSFSVTQLLHRNNKTLPWKRICSVVLSSGGAKFAPDIVGNERGEDAAAFLEDETIGFIKGKRLLHHLLLMHELQVARN